MVVSSWLWYDILYLPDCKLLPHEHMVTINSVTTVQVIQQERPPNDSIQPSPVINTQTILTYTIDHNHKISYRAIHLPNTFASTRLICTIMCWVCMNDSMVHLFPIFTMPVSISLFQYITYTTLCTIVCSKLYELLFGLQYIGLTGGISTGKSTSGKYLQSHHFNRDNVIDFDLLSREIVQIGAPAYNSIVKAFGTNILNDDQTLNRAKLGNIVFGDKSKLQQLNKLMNRPLILLFIKKSLTMFFIQRCGEILIDVPLLFEVGLHKICSDTLLIYVDTQQQVQRLMARDQCDETQAQQRINAQWPLNKKAALATHIIDNNNDIKQLHNKLAEWCEQHIRSNSCTTNDTRLLLINALKRLLLHKPNTVSFVLSLITVVPISTVLFVISILIK